IATLRFDYGEWDQGKGELTDTRNAIRWADSNFERVSLFGYSFGAGIATMAAADIDVDLEALSVLAPVSTIDDTFNPVEALTSIEIPVQVVYGTRDDTADWESYVDQARQLSMDVQQYSSDHFFVNQQDKVAETIADYLLQWLLEDPDYHEHTEEL
ncbi:MAG: dienelactone hydrolase family protein, partial [Halobacteriaceae archaeon]